MEQEFWEDSEILGKRQERTQKIYFPITMGGGGYFLEIVYNLTNTNFTT